ncbi:MAG: SusE domain-containing protein [Prevotellaceae bacterium]|jgi:hypothetical protein|nr:SusE domain-containing protein [Prevotellaceae bacterium]
MSKILNIILTTVCVSVMFSSCQTERDNPTLAANALSKPVITSTVPGSLEIVASNLADEFTLIEFTPAVYSINVPVNNTVQISLSSSFAEVASVGAATPDASISLINKSINAAIVASLGAVPFQPVTAYLRVASAVSATIGSPVTELNLSYSDPVQVTITPYEPQPAYVYAVGAFQGWNRTGDYSLISMADNGVYIGYINFPEAGSGFLIMPDNSSSWDHKYGSDDGSTLIKDAGADIQSPGAGWYRVIVDLNSMTITYVQFGNLGIVGTVNGWGTPDVAMDYVPSNHRFEATITCAGNDEIKFRLNEDWDDGNWGGEDGVAKAGGSNIKIADAGTYLVTLDFTDLDNLEYTITQQ